MFLNISHIWFGEISLNTLKYIITTELMNIIWEANFLQQMELTDSMGEKKTKHVKLGTLLSEQV